MRKILLTLLVAVLCSTSYATEIPVGYSKGKIAENSDLIVNGKGALTAALKVVPELTDLYKGNEVRGVAVGIIDSKYCDSIQVFVRTSLDGEDLATGKITRKDADKTKRPADGWNYIPLETPVTIIEGQELYVGFIYYQRYRSNAISWVGTPIENTSFVKRGPLADWEDFSSKGVLSIELLVDGDNMPQYDFRVNNAAGMLEDVGTLSVKVSVTNNGQVVPANFDLTFDAEGYNYTATLNNQVETAETKEVKVVLNDVPEGVGFENLLRVSVSRIEGGEDVMPDDNSCVVGVKVKRNVVVEEFTGTGCGWCPRGLVGMENMRNKFGDRFIGVGIHQFNNTDPMYPNYKNLNFSGAPSCRINRGPEIDPYYGTVNDVCDDFQAAMDEGAFASVEVTGVYNEDKTAVTATATLKAQTELTGTKLTFVLIADSLTGTQTSWRQGNNYAQYQASQLPADLAQFGVGGAYGQTYFYWKFNDVAIGTYYEDGLYEMSLDPLAQGSVTTQEYTLNMPTKQPLLSAIDYDYVAVIAMLLDGSGKVINAGKYYLGGEDPTGIRNLVTNDSGVREVARYTLDGRMISAPQRGVNIIRYSNGKSVKVVVE